MAWSWTPGFAPVPAVRGPLIEQGDRPHPAVRARRPESRVSNWYRAFVGPRSNHGSRPLRAIPGPHSGWSGRPEGANRR